MEINSVHDLEYLFSFEMRKNQIKTCLTRLNILPSKCDQLVIHKKIENNIKTTFFRVMFYRFSYIKW